MKEIDPITLEVVRGSFNSTVAQMRATLVRTGYSPALALRYDYSCGLLSPAGEVIGMSEDFAGHVFAMSLGLVPSLKKFGDQIYPGDVIAMNDPYVGGTHLNDVVFYTPYFADGRLIMFIGVRAHWQDIGGSTPGSYTGRAGEIFEEGLRIPPVKIIEKGKRNQGLWDLLFTNVRNRDERQGDALAMLDTTHVAEMRLAELCAKYGAEVIEKCRDAILDGAERVMRQRISELPSGEYHYEHYMDNDGTSDKPIPIKVKLKIEGDTMTFDFTGTAPQSRGPTNGGPPIAPSGVFVIVKSWLDPKTPVSGGSFRPLKFVLPEGTIVNAKFPAAVGGCWGLFRSIFGAVIGLFSQVIPDKAVGDVFGEANHTYITGRDPASGEYFILYESPMGGYPGTSENDGSTGSKLWDVGGICIYPAEFAERFFPVLMEGAEARMDGEAAGYHRSAFGITRKIRVLIDCQLSIMADKTAIPPFGVAGGYAGSLNSFAVIRNGVEIDPSPDVPGRVRAFPLQAGDVVVMKAAGGGGVGDPLDRDVELVKQDVLDGYLSPARARQVYGVVIEKGKADSVQIKKLRQQLRKQRHYLKVVASETDSFDARGLRLCAMSRSDAARLGVVDDDLVEYAPKAGAPLRAWVSVVDDLPRGELPIGPVGRSILKARAGDTVEIRSLQRHAFK
ncbi:MAG: hydantoinase B/oxoprolinase family protein [Chloroflexi bacterium]|nr:hydantoinase B/oxoprolinase family protein [Chloroflexota bacterium]